MTDLFSISVKSSTHKVRARWWGWFCPPSELRTVAAVAMVWAVLTSCSTSRYYMKDESDPKPALSLEWARMVRDAKDVFSSETQKRPCVLKTSQSSENKTLTEPSVSTAKEAHPNWLDYHVLTVDMAGVGAGAVTDGSDNGDRKTYWRHFQHLISGFEASGRSHLLLYLNGGLNSKESVLRQAAQQVPCIMHNTDYYPIFMIWSTGPLETYAEQILQARGGQIQHTHYQPAPLSLIGDIGQGIARAPIVYWDNAIRNQESTIFADELNDFGVDLPPNDPCSELQPEAGCFRHIKPPRVGEGSDNSEDMSEQALYVLATPLRVVLTPLVDAFGKTAWENMLRRSRTTVRTVWEVQPEFVRPKVQAQANREKKCYSSGTGGFSKFFHDLSRYLGTVERPNESDMCNLVPSRKHYPAQVFVTAIGHSMGTIVLNELVPKFPGLPYKNIIYMGAATSIRDFDRSMNSIIRLVHARNHRGQETDDDDIHFYNLMLHPLVEARELSGYGTLPAGSLLEWIDTMYEGPETIADRTLGKWRNVRRASHFFLGDLGEHSTFRVFGRGRGTQHEKSACAAAGFGNENCSNGSCRPWPINPEKHGEFNDLNFCFWHPAFWGEIEEEKQRKRLLGGTKGVKRR